MRQILREKETQIIGILKEADAGIPVKEICRTHGKRTA
jgi:hypothetical protein